MNDEKQSPPPGAVTLHPVNNQNAATSDGPRQLVPALFYPAQHTAYIAQLAEALARETSYEGAVTEHLRMSGVYWSLTALHILMPPDRVDRLMGVVTTPAKQQPNSSDEESPPPSSSTSSIIDWLWTCYNPDDGSFGGNTGHQGHLLYTLSALQILALADQLEEERLLQCKPRILQFIASLQQPDGSFVGDTQHSGGGGEIDTRFTYCAFQSLALLGALDKSVVRVEDACNYIFACRNLDGGFGSCIGAESHAGQVFCCVGALAMAQQLDKLFAAGDDGDDLLSWWLCERQCDSGGLNGRPEKQADVCYSWWNISALSILGKVDWINRDKLAQYILKCQDVEDGGIADRPEDMADVFHTFFGIGGLSLLGHLHQADLVLPEEGISYRPIDPLYALPTDIVQKLKLPGQVIASEDGSVDERLKNYKILRQSR